MGQGAIRATIAWFREPEGPSPAYRASERRTRSLALPREDRARKIATPLGIDL